MTVHQKEVVQSKKKVKSQTPPPTDIFKMFGLAAFPYSSKISFLPLIDYWQKKLGSNLQMERLIAHKIEGLMNIKGKALLEPLQDLTPLEGLEDLIELLISPFFPYQDGNALLRMTGPFNTLPFYHTERLGGLLKRASFQGNLDKTSDKINTMITYRAGCMILNQFYGQKLQLDTPYVFSIKDKETQLNKHFRAEINSRFAEVVKLKPLKRLSDTQIHELLSNVEDIELWLKYLPPSNFEFQGVFCTQLTDATHSETLSRLKDKLLQKDALLSKSKVSELEIELCSFFVQPNLRLGVCTINQHKVSRFHKKYGIKYGLINDKYSNLLSKKFEHSIYQKVIENNDFLVIEDLTKYPNPTELELELLSRGIKNILVTPLMNESKEVIGLFELASPIPCQLNSLSAIKLQGILPLFNVAIERSQVEIFNQLEAIVRTNFTSIHPSVEWAFVDKAYQIFKQKGDATLDENQFIFRDNYPLYAQADIVSSTVNRNKAIQEDLIDNLYKIKKLLVHSNKQYTFPLADQIKQEVDTHIFQLKRGVTSNSEYMTMDFIRNEVHPVLRYLKKKTPNLRALFREYWASLDPQLGTVYNKRRDYERSVMMINRALSTYLDREQKIAQKMCPHYYEKFQTDGVSYNIYIGQSLLRKGKFKWFHLKNLRIWQLIGMCEITQKIAELQSKLPTPLTTAQLIFVHSTPLSIRFRLDEKRFDVDGAYNARYEIIKKRIDKAYIDGTNERLTVPGKVAIVYQQENDRKEYLRYLDYLKKRGYVAKNIEELNLKKMQGVQGLKALRFTVKIENKPQ